MMSSCYYPLEITGNGFVVIICTTSQNFEQGICQQLNQWLRYVGENSFSFGRLQMFIAYTLAVPHVWQQFTPLL